LDQLKKILFYSDSKIFGGHEIMSTNIANTLIDNNYNIEFMYHNENFDLKLNNKIIKHFNAISDNTPLPFIANFNLYSILKIYKKIKKINPDFIVICQGNIEFSLKGLFASKLLKKYTISYIPLGSEFSKMNSKVSIIRDFINKYYYTLPDLFITPNLYQKNEILKKINHKNISIIKNPIDVSNVNIKFKKQNIIKLGIIGRINFKHKNQLISIDIANKLKKLNILFNFTIIGDGIDLLKFKRIINTNNLSKYFTFYNWVNRKKLDDIIRHEINLILVPSNFETGIPLVVYDAIRNNKKFLLSNIDSIQEYNIPRDFLIDINNIENILEKIISIHNLTDISNYTKIKNYLIDEFSIKNYNNQVKSVFNNILCGQ